MKNDSILTTFLKKSAALRHKIQRIYIFGSRARGTERPDSDYDLLLVVSADFSLKDKDLLYDAVMDILLDTGKLVSLKIFKENQYIRFKSEF